MNIHEYQAKELLRARGIPVLKGFVAYTAEEAAEVAKALPGPVYVVKAQIHAGGRGKGGGVKVVRSVYEVKVAAQKMLGMRLVTRQTGAQGQEVRRVYIEEGCEIGRELYLGMLIDRATSRVTIMASTEGGMDIEEVAAHSPEKIIKVAVDPAVGFQAFQGRRIAFALGLEGGQIGKTVELLGNLYKAFIGLDASVVEINPLVVTKDGDILPLDAKMNFDDNALFRQKEVEAMRDAAEEDPAEKRAKDHELSYVKLSGNIGCMVNGAGLAMATMDIIKLYGGDPANFRRRRRHQGAGGRSLPHHSFRPACRGNSGQYFRGHHALRRDCGRRDHRRARAGPDHAAGGAPRRHQRRQGQKAP